jgi:hypothetical protein
MNRIQSFGQRGRDIFRPNAEQCSALPMRLLVLARVGDLNARKAPDFWCWCKLLISRRLGPFFVFFTPFLSHKGLISRRLQEIPRKKYRGAKKTKCKITSTPGFIGKAAGDEFGGSEIFHSRRPIKKQNSKMKNQRRVRDSSPRLPPFQRAACDGHAAPSPCFRERSESDACRRVTTHIDA